MEKKYIRRGKQNQKNKYLDVFLNNDYTKEEMKLINETHKILNDTKIGISPTAVRIPVIGGHSESVNIEFNKTFQINEIKIAAASNIIYDKMLEKLNNF